LSDGVIDKILRRQDSVLHNVGQDSRVVFIIDDAIYSTKQWLDDSMRVLFMHGAASSITTIVTMQYCIGIPASLSAYVDFTFLFRNPSLRDRRILHESFVPHAECAFEAFCQIMDEYTEGGAGHGALVVHNTARGRRLEDRMFHYRAELHPDFRMCADVSWALRVVTA
jgi:hypothetical protein